MPHVTLQLSPGGALIDIIVGLTLQRHKALTAAGQQIPKPLSVRALVDTGASSTCIDPSVLKALNLDPTGKTLVHTPSTGGTPMNADTYDVSITLFHPLVTFTMGAIGVVESQIAVQGVRALLGRDVLANCLVIYDGRNGTFSLAF